MWPGGRECDARGIEIVVLQDVCDSRSAENVAWRKGMWRQGHRNCGPAGRLRQQTCSTCAKCHYFACSSAPPAHTEWKESTWKSIVLNESCENKRSAMKWCVLIGKNKVARLRPSFSMDSDRFLWGGSGCKNVQRAGDAFLRNHGTHPSLPLYPGDARGPRI